MDHNLFPVPTDSWKNRLGLHSSDHTFDELHRRERLARAIAKPAVETAVAPADLSTHNVVVQPLFDNKAQGSAAGLMENILNVTGAAVSPEDPKSQS